MSHRDASVKIPKPPDSKVKQPDFCYLFAHRGRRRIVGREGRAEEIDFFPFFFFSSWQLLFLLLFLDQELDIMKEKEEREKLTRENVNKRKSSINNSDKEKLCRAQTTFDVVVSFAERTVKHKRLF